MWKAVVEIIYGGNYLWKMIEHIIKTETGPSAKTEVLDLDMVSTWSGHGLEMVWTWSGHGRTC